MVVCIACQLHILCQRCSGKPRGHHRRCAGGMNCQCLAELGHRIPDRSCQNPETEVISYFSLGFSRTTFEAESQVQYRWSEMPLLQSDCPIGNQILTLSMRELAGGIAAVDRPKQPKIRLFSIAPSPRSSVIRSGRCRRTGHSGCSRGRSALRCRRRGP